MDRVKNHKQSPRHQDGWHNWQSQKGQGCPIDDRQIFLHIMIVKAIGTDGPASTSSSSTSTTTLYSQWRAWQTNVFDPLWDKKGMIFLDKLDNRMSLKVLRFNSKLILEPHVIGSWWRGQGSYSLNNPLHLWGLKGNTIRLKGPPYF